MTNTKLSEYNNLAILFHPIPDSSSTCPHEVPHPFNFLIACMQVSVTLHLSGTVHSLEVPTSLIVGWFCIVHDHIIRI